MGSELDPQQIVIIGGALLDSPRPGRFIADQ
jgi:hypothetical protein